MMTVEQIQSRIAELQQRRDLLEREALQHEQAARDKRAERDKCKADIAELGKSALELGTMNAAQQAMAAAQQAQKHAESHAATAQETADRHKAALAETEALNAQLKERLAVLDAAAKSADAPAA